MVKQDVKRNGRGQIVSYELNPVSYGEVLLSNTNFQNVEKYGRLSFEANVDFRIVEFANSDILIDPMVDLGFVPQPPPTETSRQSVRSPQPPPAGLSGAPSPGRTNLPGSGGSVGSGGLGGAPSPGPPTGPTGAPGGDGGGSGGPPGARAPRS